MNVSLLNQCHHSTQTPSPRAAADINFICMTRLGVIDFAFLGDVILPSKEEMKKDIESKRCSMHERYVKSRRHTLQVEHACTDKSVTIGDLYISHWFSRGMLHCNM